MSIPARTPILKSCPYPNCQHDSAWQVSGLIFCCARCLRLSVRCEKENCTALNRPYMRYCRRCRADTETAACRRQSWEAASSAGLKVLPTTIAPPSTIHQFPRSETGALLGFSFLKGLLAVHQAGGDVALLHPFCGGENQPGLVWQDREGLGSPIDVRPFPPVLFANQRHIVFSSPCGIAVLSCWSLPEWRFDGPPEYRVLVVAEDGAEIVATPVQLSATELGYLTWNLHTNEYHWHVINWPAPDSNSMTHKLPPITLNLRGCTCQVQALGQEFITFTTPEGHWIWRAADAAAGHVQTLKQTYPKGKPPADYELKSDSYANFRNPTQFIYLPPAAERQRNMNLRMGRYIEWYFQQQVSRAVSLNYYRIDTSTLEPLAVSEIPQAAYIPLGRHLGDAQQPVVLAQGSQLKYGTLGGDVKTVPGFAPVHDFETAAGIVFSDPLIVSIHRCVSHERRLILRSLAAPGRVLEVAVKGLLAEPLIWSHWLFTAEVEENQIHIRRHDLESSEVALA